MAMVYDIWLGLYAKPPALDHCLRKSGIPTPAGRAPKPVRSIHKRK
jgi:hypothetical protein